MEKEFDKNTEVKRLVIYLILSFGLTWNIFFASILNGFKWDGSNPYMESFIGLGMLMPFAASILTRMITKEGFAMTGRDSLMLGISFKGKKWKCYLIALFLPWLYYEITNAFAIAICPTAFDMEYVNNYGISKGLAIVFPIIVISQTSILSFAALGEEGGWRGYMMPKLMKLMGQKRAFLVGGIIWGLWHAPLTCIGHNFGTDYPGFPYVGILLMCIFCTLIGTILTMLTIKSGSIWPATIMHAVNNGMPSILRFFINEEVYMVKISFPLSTWIILFGVMVVVVIMMWIVMNKVTACTGTTMN